MIVFLGNKAKKAYEHLDAKTKAKIYSLFEVLSTNPWPARVFDMSKIHGINDCFRIRIGDYRIYYRVNAGRGEIEVYNIERKSETTYN
ncbi:hypothetical protein AUJ17_02910 [Candidatus Micrarchaeota archaeon CG1_02_47_40]|nr:MAG: hypothetical protein AUJ17_02910 [Candidatus Micrarchaeota archaeon CG1_02_47_40]